MPMLVAAVTAVLNRDLQTLRREVEAYPDERQLWKVAPGITNPGGTLVLHLLGNLQHYIGRQLGGTGYVRDRPAEFSRRNVPRAALLQEIAAAERAVARLATLDAGTLQKEFPEAVGGSMINTAEFLVHIACHFTYHLGQIDYHRRLITGQNTPVPGLRPAELSTARPV
jgi:uncharacterized damage-inducible protein DinB